MKKPKFDDADDFEAVESRADAGMSASVAKYVLLTAIAGGLGMMAAGPMLAGSFAAVPMLAGYKKIQKCLKISKFVSLNPGCLAHLIKSEADMKIYIKELGAEEVARQLALALDRGQKLTYAARKTVTLLGVAPAPTLESVIEGLAPKAIAAADEAETITEPINLNDFDPTVFDPNNGTGSLPLAVILKSPLSSYLMIGGQRTGKSYFIAVATMLLARQGFKIYHVNLASVGQGHEDEDSYYWRHTTRSFCADLSTITDEAEAEAAIEGAMNVVNEFWDLPRTEKAILVCDEITLAGSKENYHAEALKPYLRLVAGKISSLTTTGMKRQKAIWCACPGIVAGSLQGAAKSIKCLRLVYFAISPGQFADWSGNAISFDHEVHAQICANWTSTQMISDTQIDLLKAHNIDRVCWIGDQWMPTGELPQLDKSIGPSAIIPASFEAQVAVATPGTIGSRPKVELLEPIAPIGQTQEVDLERVIYSKIVDKIIQNGGKPETLSKIRKAFSTKQQKAYTDSTEIQILEDDRFEWKTTPLTNGHTSISIWVKTDSTNNK